MNKKRLIYLTTITSLFFLSVNFSQAQSDLAEKLSGTILLQTEAKGEAWYVNPTDLKRYYFGQPAEAFNIMKKLSLGITDEDLSKIPIGLLNIDGDNDNDGLANATELAIGTDPDDKDTDNDSYEDGIEIYNNYSPLGPEKIKVDLILSKKNAGRLFLQVEKAGQCWYVNPVDLKRYFLGKPNDALNIMKNFGLGITNKNLNKISTGNLKVKKSVSDTITVEIVDNNNYPIPNDPPASNDPGEVLKAAASAIRSNDKEEAITYFTPNLEKAISYTMNFLNSDSKLLLGNILSGAKLTSSTNDEKIYSTTAYFSGYTTTLIFHVKKQEDGKWLIENL